MTVDQCKRRQHICSRQQWVFARTHKCRAQHGVLDAVGVPGAYACGGFIGLAIGRAQVIEQRGIGMNAHIHLSQLAVDVSALLRRHVRKARGHESSTFRHVFHVQRDWVGVHQSSLFEVKQNKFNSVEWIIYANA